MKTLMLLIPVTIIALSACNKGNDNNEECADSLLSSKSDDAVVIEDTKEESRYDVSIVEKLNSISIPIVDFENTSVDEAFDFLRLRIAEYDREPSMKMERHSVASQKSKHSKDSSSSASNTFNPYLISFDHLITYSASDVPLFDVISEIARQSRIDAYVTSVGVMVTPEGKPPFPNPQIDKGKVWEIIRKSK